MSKPKILVFAPREEPPETIGRVGNLFGNDASLQSVSTNLAGAWADVVPVARPEPKP